MAGALFWRQFGFVRNLQGRRHYRKKKRKSARIPLYKGLAIGERVLVRLAANEAVIRCSYVGSLRRMQETVGDVDLLAASTCPEKVIEAFLALDDWSRSRAGLGSKFLARHHPKLVKRIEEQGLRKVVAYNSEGIRVHLWVVPPEKYGTALLALSGNALHVDAIYRRFLRLMYGSISGTVRHWSSSFDGHVGLLALGKAELDEENFYECLGMQWVPPPLREGDKELSAAIEEKIPRLVELSDLRGQVLRASAVDFESASFRDFVFAAADQRYEYLALIRNANSAKRDGWLIRKLNKELDGKLSLLLGIEIELGNNSELSYPISNFDGIDFVVASVAECPRDSSKQLTRKLIQAVQHPHVQLVRFRHDKKNETQFDPDAVFQTGCVNHVAFEIEVCSANVSLPGHILTRAISCGASLALSTCGLNDPYSVRLGLGAIQRAWASAEQIVNTWPLERLKEYFEPAALKGHFKLRPHTVIDHQSR